MTLSLTWNPLIPSAWAEAFGFAQAPLLKQSADRRPTLLRDGRRGSLVFADDLNLEVDLTRDATVLSWTWSANVRTVIIPDTTHRDLIVRQWHDPSLIRRFRAPGNLMDARRLLARIEEMPVPNTPDVVDHVMQVFRHLRKVTSTTDAVSLLHILLMSLRSSELTNIQKRDSITFRELLDLEPIAISLPDHILAQPAGEYVRYLLEPEPHSGCKLYSDLLLRHAASQVFQEAHLAVERQAFLFVGMTAPPSQSGPREVRYTPANLARSMVEQTLALVDDRDCIHVLDPACGSGVFLSEAIQASKEHNLTLTGYDISPIATAVAESCLSLLSHDTVGPHSRTKFEVKTLNALQVGDWPLETISKHPFEPMNGIWTPLSRSQGWPAANVSRNRCPPFGTYRTTCGI